MTETLEAVETTLSPLLTYAEAGRYLHKSATYVRGLVYDGALSIKRIGRTPYVHIDVLDAYIDSIESETGDAARRPEMTPRHRRRVSA